MPELRTHQGCIGTFQGVTAEIDHCEAAGLPTASYGVADTPPSSSSPSALGWPSIRGTSR